MIDFVDILPFLRITSKVAMATMHFHIAEPCLFLETFLPCGFPGNNSAPIRNCPGGAR